MEQIDKLFIATKAFIVNNGKVLVLRESTQYSDGGNAGRFDVPGGRLNPGEHFEEVLKREVKEETGLEVTIGKPVYVGEWRPTVKKGGTGKLWEYSSCADLSQPKSHSVKITPKRFGLILGKQQQSISSKT